MGGEGDCGCKEALFCGWKALTDGGGEGSSCAGARFWSSLV